MPSEVPLPTVDDVLKRLHAVEFRLAEAHKSDAAQAENRHADVVQLEESLKVDASEFARSSERFLYFQQLHLFVANLAACYDEKEPLLEGIEDQFHDLLSEELVALREHRVLCLRTAPQDLLPFLQMDWTHPSLANVQVRLQTIAAQIRELHEQHQRLFDDVKPEFKDMASLKVRFDDWKQSHPDSFKASYAHLSFVGLLELLARHETVFWMPLRSPPAVFGWMDPGLELPPDGIAKLCASVLAPKFEGMLRHVFDLFVNPGDVLRSVAWIAQLAAWLSDSRMSKLLHQAVYEACEGSITHLGDSLCELAPGTTVSADLAYALMHVWGLGGLQSLLALSRLEPRVLSLLPGFIERVIGPIARLAFSHPTLFVDLISELVLALPDVLLVMPLDPVLMPLIIMMKSLVAAISQNAIVFEKFVLLVAQKNRTVFICILVRKTTERLVKMLVRVHEYGDAARLSKQFGIS